MIRQIEKESSFIKDVKVLAKKHYNFSELEILIKILQENKTIPNKYKDHYLQGNLQGYKECHIDNKILLMYQIIDNIVFLCRIGNHNDLLNK